MFVESAGDAVRVFDRSVGRLDHRRSQTLKMAEQQFMLAARGSVPIRQPGRSRGGRCHHGHAITTGRHIRYSGEGFGLEGMIEGDWHDGLGE